MKNNEVKCHIYKTGIVLAKPDEEEYLIDLVSDNYVVYVSKSHEDTFYNSYEVFFYVPDNVLFAKIYFRIFSKTLLSARLVSCLSQVEGCELMLKRFGKFSPWVSFFPDGGFYLRDYKIAVNGLHTEIGSKGLQNG